jgi:hypothetical protein
MDHSVNSDVETLRAVQDAIEAVLCSVNKLPSLVGIFHPLDIPILTVGHS